MSRPFESCTAKDGMVLDSENSGYVGHHRRPTLLRTETTKTLPYKQSSVQTTIK